MIFDKYDSYKDTGVEWLGKIPSDWKVKRVKEIIYNSLYGTSEKTQNEGIYEVLGMRDINNGKINFPHKSFLNHVKKELILKNGDLLLNRTNSLDLVGKVGLIEKYVQNVSFASYLIKLSLKLTNSKSFFNYFLNSNDFISKARSNSIQTANQANLSSSKYLQFLVFLPSLKEQIKISNFLDKKTSQVDKKIKFLQEKKESYEELKKSLINETVCRGMNKNVELKDSGIEWIGKIPKHWKVERGKDKFFYEKKINKRLICKNVLSLTYDGVINKDFNTNAGLNPGSYETYQFVNKEDLIFKLIDLENIKTSRVGIVHEHGIMSSAYIRLKPKKSTFSRYYYYLYFFYYRINLFNFLGGGVRSTLNYSSLLEIPIINPLFIEEQIQITDYLDEKTFKIDKNISKINDQIETLNEFRKTLINNIVTGKVRIQDE